VIRRLQRTRREERNRERRRSGRRSRRRWRRDGRGGSSDGERHLATDQASRSSLDPFGPSSATGKPFNPKCAARVRGRARELLGLRSWPRWSRACRAPFSHARLRWTCTPSYTRGASTYGNLIRACENGSGSCAKTMRGRGAIFGRGGLDRQCRDGHGKTVRRDSSWPGAGFTSSHVVESTVPLAGSNVRVVVPRASLSYALIVAVPESPVVAPSSTLTV
jgi:hypothetical protein